nr:immunoglobulin heavy chain junction region [Macaca mulatta]MOW24232.1 immunoglobulin heavy chain junction region [Macaca mulatta]MOW24472.1 immunoglobulin heavy chain junction region [Macaca mulatta]MOW25518.1 immunoglobulin heavy chain junction region [Macaca mulatta]MOW25844.1 immunoglobulin heavy chain junction region [Macaca mulatta]
CARDVVVVSALSWDDYYYFDYW